MKHNQRIAQIIFIFLLVSWFSSGAEFVASKSSNETKIKTIQIINAANGYVLEKNKKKRLKISILPNSATNKKVKWKSSKPSVLTVSSKGVIKAKKKGFAYITVKATDGSKKFTRCKIFVGKKVKNVKVTNISNGHVLEKKEQLQLKVSIKPTSAANKKLKWESDNPSIVTISSKGVLQAKENGSASVTATASDGSKVYIQRKINIGTRVKKVKIDGQNYVGLGGKKITLAASISPEAATVKKVTWESDNPKIATVSSKGIVAGKKTGTTVITAKAIDGSKKKSTFNIQVVIPKKSAAMFVAHRGYSSIAPENTIPAFMEAIQANFDAVECDIWEVPNPSGQVPNLMIMHDQSLLRMCGIDTLITDLTGEELTGFPVINGNQIGKYGGSLPIPTLEEYLDCLIDNETIPVIEIKRENPDDENNPISEEGVETLMETLVEKNLERPIFISSFHLSSLKEIIRIWKQDYSQLDLHLRFLTRDIDQLEPMLLEQYRNDEIDGISISAKIASSDIISRIKAADLAVGVWVVDDTTLAYKLTSIDKVDSVVSNKKVFQ